MYYYCALNVYMCIVFYSFILWHKEQCTVLLLFTEWLCIYIISTVYKCTVWHVLWIRTFGSVLVVVGVIHVGLGMCGSMEFNDRSTQKQRAVHTLTAGLARSTFVGDIELRCVPACSGDMIKWVRQTLALSTNNGMTCGCVLVVGVFLLTQCTACILWHNDHMIMFIIIYCYVHMIVHY